MTKEKIREIEHIYDWKERFSETCMCCEYYGNSRQATAKKKTCINPKSPYIGCKRISNGKCKAFAKRSDGKITGAPIAWYKSLEAVNNG
jgi:GDP-D-mannose dehydratase